MAMDDGGTRPRDGVTAQVGAASQAGNLGRGRQARKSKSGCVRATRRGPKKAVAGRAMKVVPTVREGEPEGEGSSGGERAGRGLNNCVLRRIGGRSKALKAGARRTVTGSNRALGGGCNDTRAAAGDELARLLAGGNP
jgi:hypothetical protein